MATRKSRKKHVVRRTSSSSKTVNQARFKMMLYIAMTLVGVLIVLNLINQNYSEQSSPEPTTEVMTY